jgi:hypothetical protein
LFLPFNSRVWVLAQETGIVNSSFVTSRPKCLFPLLLDIP